jgi:SAM-dependent methyltransferase
MNLQENIKNTVAYENEQWTEIFKKELQNKSKKNFSSFWWEDYYLSIVDYFDKYILSNNYKTLLEPGCGSGKATILLKSDIEKDLLDISSSALEYSKYLSQKFNPNKISFIQGDVFNLEGLNKTYDFIWNVGMIEHYTLDQLEIMFDQLIVHTKQNGTVALGVPNFYSGPTLKAYLLSFNLFKNIKGYRLDTEKFYSDKEIFQTFKVVCDKKTRKIENYSLVRFGNPLIMETPDFFLKRFGLLIKKFFYKNQFLKFYIFKL